MALHDALVDGVERKLVQEYPIVDHLAAISVGIVDGVPLLDLEYVSDVNAETDMNVVMTGRGLLVEVQGTAEQAPFSRDELNDMLDLAAAGIEELVEAQRQLIA